MISTKSAIQCQQCGGKVSTVPGRDYLQCDYCRSLTFTTDNPLTVDRITPLGTQPEQADCPVCTTALSAGQIEARPILYCQECYGLLLTNRHFGAIVRERRARREGSDAQICRKLNTDDYARQIRCPNCAESMEVHPYYGPGNIVIDSCQSCRYVWLDHGELRTVERAEGGAEPKVTPLHVNNEGDVTNIPTPPNENLKTGFHDRNSLLSVIADALFGF